MAATKIPWAEKSWNPIRYLDGWMCTKVSPGCLHCYAESHNLRFGNGLRYMPENCKAENFRLDEKVLNQPLHWRNPSRIFVQSMGDLFHEQIPAEMIRAVTEIPLLTPQHTYIFLTKRPVRMASKSACDPEWRWPDNTWWGVTVESEKYLWRLNALNQIPAAVKFVSLEPLLEEIHIEDYLKIYSRNCLTGCRERQNVGKFWVICGPETGSGRRLCKPEWIRSIIDQGDEAKVPVFVKAFPMGKRISHNPAEWSQWAQRREYTE